MVGEWTLTGLAVPDSIDLLQDLLARVREERPELDEADLFMLELAVVEIHGNVVEHGEPRGEVTYAFQVKVYDDRLVGILADTGTASPDLSELDRVSDEMAESGRGLWLAQASLDAIDYQRIGERNKWTMVRRRRDADATPADDDGPAPGGQDA